jgi:hypothetical protein
VSGSASIAANQKRIACSMESVTRPMWIIAPWRARTMRPPKYFVVVIVPKSALNVGRLTPGRCGSFGSSCLLRCTICLSSKHWR